jgi:flagellar biosynthesis protein FlhA
MAKSVQQVDESKDIVIDPVIAKKILTSLMAKCDELLAKGTPAVLVVSPPIRLPVRRFFERYVKQLNVISHNEISDNVRLESLGALTVE